MWRYESDRTQQFTQCRTNGLTIIITGYATIHDNAQEDSHSELMSGDMPLARKVAIPDTIHVMKPERRKLNRKGANLGCMRDRARKGEFIGMTIIEWASVQAALLRKTVPQRRRWPHIHCSGVSRIQASNC